MRFSVFQDDHLYCIFVIIIKFSLYFWKFFKKRCLKFEVIEKLIGNHLLFALFYVSQNAKYVCRCV